MPSPRPERTRRSWPQRLFIAFNVVAILAAGTMAGALAYSNQRLGEVDRLLLEEDLHDEELEEGDPLNVLLVGIDDASGLPEGDTVRNRSRADLAGQHTDTVMVVRLDPGAGTVQLLSLPRDLWVPIAETNTTQRINAAMSTGGPGRLIKTINENFGIPIHQYVQVDMAGFRELVEIVDGVPVHFPHPARDRNSGLAIEVAGCYTLGPQQALGFARSRYYQAQDADGRWHWDPRSDLSRVERQQLFIQLALGQAFAKGARNPNTLRRLVDLGSSAVTLDELWDPGAILDLGHHFRSFDPDELQTFNLPVTDGMVGDDEILYLQDEAAEPIFAVFRGVGPLGSAAPPDARVQVLNGSGVDGQGASVTDELVRAGFAAIVPENAGSIGEPTTIRYAEGNEAEAHLVARYVAGPIRYEIDPRLADIDQVVLITGSDWAGVAPTPKAVEEVDGPTTTTTTTTAPSAEPGDLTPGPEGDPDDPDDPLFYRAMAPTADMHCPPTP